MGCSSSAVVPFDSDVDDSCPVKVRVNPSTPDQINIKDRKNDFVGKKNSIPTEVINSQNAAPSLAFEVPAFDEDEQSLIKKYPPRRLRKFDEIQSDGPDLSHETIDERQKEAEARRKEILNQRIMSAKRGNRRILDPVTFPNLEKGETWEKNM